MRDELSSLEGIEIKGDIDLRSVDEGYVQFVANESSALTLAKLKETLKSTPFELKDVRWPVQSVESDEPE